MENVWLKLHLVFLVISIVTFIGRSLIAFKSIELANSKLALLATFGSMAAVILSAVMLAMNTELESAWLMEKAAGLVFYVLLGVLSLKPQTPTLPRLVLGVFAITAFATTFMVAKAHAPIFL